MHRSRWVVATTIVLGLLPALLALGACSPEPLPGDVRRPPGTTGTSRPKPAVPTPVGEDPLPPALEERLQRVLDATRPTLSGTPGLIAGVWVPGVGAWASISVEADPAETEPLATNDHVRIGTVTTSMTVALVLRLVDQGKLSLDDPISTWFPEIPDGAQITVRHLATMRSGIADTVHGAEVQRARAADRSRSFTPEELTGVDGFLGTGLHETREFAPGAESERSDTGTILLGRIVEKVTGTPFRVALQEELLGPLGLRDTALPEVADASIPRPTTRGYTPTAPGAKETVEATGWNPSWLSYAGAATSTVRDLMVWGYHLGSGSLLAPRTFEAQRDFGGGWSGSGVTGYGMGLMSFSQPPALASVPGLPWVGFEGSIDGYSTLVAFDPVTQAVVVVIATSDVPVQIDVNPDIPTIDGTGALQLPTMRAFEALRDVLRADPPPTTVATMPLPGTTVPG